MLVELWRGDIRQVLVQLGDDSLAHMIGQHLAQIAQRDWRGGYDQPVIGAGLGLVFQDSGDGPHEFGFAVFGGGLCTSSDARRFFSHRRDRRTGRQAALIWLQA